MSTFRPFITAVLFLFLYSPCFGQQLDAKQTYKQGTAYYYGEGVKQDYAEAARLFRQAAEQSDKNAQYALGWMYLGNGASKNYGEAIKWFRKAAEQDDVLSQLFLGIFYSSSGTGFEVDNRAAVKWFQAAANQGNATAQYRLGLHYFHGNGVKKAPQRAVEWFRKASESGNSDANDALNKIFNNQKANVKLAGGDYSAGWGSLAEIIWDARSNPQKGNIYNVTPMDGIRVQQVTKQGVFVRALFGPPETSGRMVFIYKSNGFGEGLVDGAMIPPGYFQYIGPYSYNSLAGERTVYSFKPVSKPSH